MLELTFVFTDLEVSEVTGSIPETPERPRKPKAVAVDTENNLQAELFAVPGLSLLRPAERRVFLVAPGLAFLPQRSGISDFYSVCGPQTLMVSGVLTGLLFSRTTIFWCLFARILHAELPSNLLMEPACHFENYLDGHITSLLIQVHWENADSCGCSHSSGPFVLHEPFFHFLLSLYVR